MGVLLPILRRVSLPAGAMALIFLVYSALTMIVTRNPVFPPIWLIVGILSDAAMVLWSVYYAFFMLTGIGGGIWLTGYIWTGSIVEAARDADRVAKPHGRPLPGQRYRHGLRQ